MFSHNRYDKPCDYVIIFGWVLGYDVLTLVYIFIIVISSFSSERVVVMFFSESWTLSLEPQLFEEKLCFGVISGRLCLICIPGTPCSCSSIYFTCYLSSCCLVPGFKHLHNNTPCLTWGEWLWCFFLESQLWVWNHNYSRKNTILGQFGHTVTYIRPPVVSSISFTVILHTYPCFGIGT